MRLRVSFLFFPGWGRYQRQAPHAPGDARTGVAFAECGIEKFTTQPTSAAPRPAGRGHDLKQRKSRYSAVFPPVQLKRR